VTALAAAGMALRLLLFAALLAAAAAGKPSAKLIEAIKQAAEKQAFQEDATTTSHEVDAAPAANLTGGTGDVPTNGPCAEDIVIFCQGIKPGYAHLAECLNNQIFDERDGNSEYTVKVSAPCRGAVLKFKMALAQNINLDVNMAADCKDDAKQFCDYVKDFKFPGKVIACLREKKPNLKGKCKRAITKAQIEAAEDYRLDANLYDACKADAANVCKDVEAGSGRVNACLRENRLKARLKVLCTGRLHLSSAAALPCQRLIAEPIVTALASRTASDLLVDALIITYCVHFRWMSREIGQKLAGELGLPGGDVPGGRRERGRRPLLGAAVPHVPAG
jgi:Cysteine rich repeat